MSEDFIVINGERIPTFNTPGEFWDRLPHMSFAEAKLTLCFYRYPGRTFLVRELGELAGLSRPSVITGLRAVKRRGLIVLPDERPGYIYVIGAENGLHKIGLTYGPIKERLAELRTMSPIPLSLELTIPAVEPSKLERQLHTRFAKHRHHGEWFDLTEEDIEWIRKEYADDQSNP